MYVHNGCSIILKKGMDGFVPKPFKVDQLISEIEKAHLSKEK